MTSSSNSPNSLRQAIQKYYEALKDAFGEEKVDEALKDAFGEEKVSKALKNAFEPGENVDKAADDTFEEEKVDNASEKLEELKPQKPFRSFIGSICHTLDGDSVPSEKKPSLQQILNVLHARDAIQARLEEIPSFNEDSLAPLVLIYLDQFLKDQANTIVQKDNLVKACQSLKRRKSSWWWFLEPKPLEPWWSKWDWAWNGLTIITLVIAGSYITVTIKAFSVGGFDLLGAISTLGQGAIATLFAGGILTEKGQKVVDNILTSLGFPKHLHAEALFIASFAFCLGAYWIQNNLKLVGEYYIRQGQNYEQKSKRLLAQEQYERALNFAPGEPKLYLGLGNVYQHLGDLAKAEEMYKKGFSKNDSEAGIRLSKVILVQAFQANGWKKIVKREGKEKPADWQIKQQAEQQAKIRESENYLNLTLARMQEVTKVRMQREVETKTSEEKGDYSSHDVLESLQKQLGQSPIEERQQVQEIYLNKGILALSQVNLDYPDPDVAKFLYEAIENFKQAEKITRILPTTLENPAECYLAIANATQKKFNNFNDAAVRYKEPSFTLSSIEYHYIYKSEKNFYDDLRNQKKAVVLALGLDPSQFDQMINDLQGRKILQTLAAQFFYDRSYSSGKAQKCYISLNKSSEPFGKIGFNFYDGLIMKRFLEIRW